MTGASPNVTEKNDMTAIKTVGMIGLGKMGAPMARHLAAKGFDVTGYDIDPAAARSLAAHGVKAAASPAALATACECVIVVVAFEHQVEAVLFGDNGVTSGARPGTIVGIAATISPQGMKRMAARLQEHKLVVLDIPLCRGEPAAEVREIADCRRRRQGRVRALPSGLRGFRGFGVSSRRGRRRPDRQDGQ